MYYQNIRRRIEKLEAHLFPEPETVVTVYSLDKEGLPYWVCTVGRSNWMRKEGEPIPQEFLKHATPKARAAYEAKTNQQTEPTNRTLPATRPVAEIREMRGHQREIGEIGDRRRTDGLGDPYGDQR